MLINKRLPSGRCFIVAEAVLLVLRHYERRAA